MKQYRPILHTSLLTVLLLMAGLMQAQKKADKPIKLQAKTDNHRVSMEMDNDIFYFTNEDLIVYFQKQGDEGSLGAANYLKNYHKEIAFKKGQSNFRNAGERILHTALELNLKQLVLAGKASDVVKEGNKPNLFVIVTKCASDSTRQTLTEKKGRIILDCL